MEQGVYQHHIVDRSRFLLAHEGEPACDSGGGDPDDADDYGGAG
ncbi:hypothetical protein A2U01_0033358 [Trifolium medium]|uniref:Uncharacterized protein n=1 Tax=Trifolium medium TaxID=97028 RepID=A0A392PMY2_9FABA|nr:hypothetical protein [Trifolium medium]